MVTRVTVLLVRSAAKLLFAKELKLGVLKGGIVEAGQDVGDAQSLRDALGLLELLLIEGDVVVLCYVLERS